MIYGNLEETVAPDFDPAHVIGWYDRGSTPKGLQGLRNLIHRLPSGRVSLDGISCALQGARDRIARLERSALVWTYAVHESPNGRRTVLAAIRGYPTPVPAWYDGRDWRYPIGGAEIAGVYAWAELPPLPPLPETTIP